MKLPKLPRRAACLRRPPPVLPLVIERLSHPRECVRKKAVMALLHFHHMDPDRSGALMGALQQGCSAGVLPR